MTDERTTFASGAQKDQKDARFGLIPPNALREVARVYGYGADKYDARNWEKGLPFGPVYDAAQRHLNSFNAGVDLDAESGLHHLAHAAFGILSLLEYTLTGTGTDDRTALRPVDTEHPPSEPSGIYIHTSDPGETLRAYYAAVDELKRRGQL